MKKKKYVWSTSDDHCDGEVGGSIAECVESALLSKFDKEDPFDPDEYEDGAVPASVFVYEIESPDLKWFAAGVPDLVRTRFKEWLGDEYLAEDDREAELADFPKSADEELAAAVEKFLNKRVKYPEWVPVMTPSYEADLETGVLSVEWYCGASKKKRKEWRLWESGASLDDAVAALKKERRSGFEYEL